MSSTPKWYCRNKSQPMHTFVELSKLGDDLRRITKRLIIDVKVDIFNEQDTLLEECERIVELYWSLKDQSCNNDFQSLTKKIKRSPYNALLIKKFNIIMEFNDRRFCQLTFVLKRTLSVLLKKSLQSEIWLNWALQITQLYNKCRQPSKVTDNGEVEKSSDKLNSNICSNLYPSLLLPFKSIDFGYVLQLTAQQRIEQNALDLMFGLFNMGEQQAWRDNNESNCSSIEILRILTLNLTADGDFQQFINESPRSYTALNLNVEMGQSVFNDTAGSPTNLRRKHIELFLQNERSFVAQFIEKSYDICPTIYGRAAQEDLHEFVLRGMRLMWSYVGIILDHIILWWIDTPISCYSLTHVDSIRNWMLAQNVKEIPEPVYSTLQGIGEILTNFVCINLWDRLFRLTLISATAQPKTMEQFMEQNKPATRNEFGTPTGTVWIAIFENLINLSNNFFQNVDMSNPSLVPVAEQIPILHRIDHSVHCMRLWVKEEAKQLCNEWRMDRYFQILENDVKLCLHAFSNLKLPKLTADLKDILMLVCVALRTKLICEINVNIDKLKKTTDECVQVLSDVCRLLSLANFNLCFPSASYWQKKSFDDKESCSQYVDYILDQIFMPCIKATKDVLILKLILKIICEAWLDFIYQRRIRFSVNGALRLLKDFDEVREWINSCPLLDEQQLDKLGNHEVLRMCKGVGKILLRKPEDVIAITQTPKYDKRVGDDSAPQETQLPSEMFVSNQKHWLQLRAKKSTFFFFPLCCGETS